MGIIETIKGMFTPGAPTAVASADAAKAVRGGHGMSPGQMWLTNYIGGTGASGSYSDTPEGWVQAVKYNVWASNSVDAREKGVAGVGFEIKRVEDDNDAQAEEDEAVTHPVIDLINRANMRLLKTQTSFKAQIARQRSIFGDSYILKVRNAKGVPEEMFVLPALFVLLVRDYQTGYVTGYTYSGVTYPLEDVIRIYDPDDTDPWLARSPASTAIAAINRYGLADLMQEYIDRNGGRGGGNLSFDAQYLNVDIGKFIAEYNAIISDPHNAGKYAALPQGATLLENTLTAVQMQREERNKRLKQETFAAFHVPPAIAGDYSDASVLANADAQERKFATSYQVPELDMIAEMLTVDLLWQDWPETKDEGLYIAPVYTDIPALNEDKKLREDIEGAKSARMLSLLQGGAVTLNEAREALEYEPISDPRADDVFMIVSPGAPDGGDGKEAGAAAPAPVGEALSTSSLSTIRQVSQSYGKGDIGDDQARQLLRLAKPDISDAEMKALLIPPAPVEPEPEVAQPEEVKEEVEPLDPAPVLEVLTAWQEGTISEDAARVLLTDMLPDADDGDIDALLTEPEDVDDEEAIAADEDIEAVSDDDISSEVDALLSETGATKADGYITRRELHAMKAEGHTGVMVALMLNSEAAQTLLPFTDIPGATETTPADEMHITLAYLGDAYLYSDEARGRILHAVWAAACRTATPISATIKGSGRFVNPYGDAIYAGVAVEGLDALQRDIVSTLRALGVNVADTHGDYRPHVTLAYVPSGAEAIAPAVPPVFATFSAITIMWAGERFDFPTGGSGDAYGYQGAAHYISAKAKDVDGDGFVFDSTKMERPARPDEKVGAGKNRRISKAEKMLEAARKRKAKKKGKGKKPKMTEAEKEKKKAEAKAKRDAERVAQLQAEEKSLRDALIALEGKDDPSNLRQRISKALERIAARIESIQSGNSASTSKLLAEARNAGGSNKDGDSAKAVDVTTDPTVTGTLSMSANATGDVLYTTVSPVLNASDDVTIASPFSLERIIPIVDAVGQMAIGMDGQRIGVIQKIRRITTPGDEVEATKANPAIYIDGRVYRLSEIRGMVIDA